MRIARPDIDRLRLRQCLLLARDRVGDVECEAEAEVALCDLLDRVDQIDAQPGHVEGAGESLDGFRWRCCGLLSRSCGLLSRCCGLLERALERALAPALGRARLVPALTTSRRPRRMPQRECRGRVPRRSPCRPSSGHDARCPASYTRARGVVRAYLDRLRDLSSCLDS